MRAIGGMIQTGAVVIVTLDEADLAWMIAFLDLYAFSECAVG